MSEKQPLVVVEKVTKKFLHEGREMEILRGIDLTIERGEMLCIVGASGAGKSTLLHILGTLDLPTSGRISFEGREVTRLPSSELADFRNRSIGFVFQFHHLLPEFSALENVMMPGLIRGDSRAALSAKAQKLLKEVGLEHRLTHRPGELSGGEQQRVALARALIMEPKLVLADEPTGNLDSKTSDDMHRLFFDLNERLGVTFLVVTHSRDLAALMPRVVTMRDGSIQRDERRAPLRVPGEGREEDDDAYRHANDHADDPPRDRALSGQDALAPAAGEESAAMTVEEPAPAPAPSADDP